MRIFLQSNTSSWKMHNVKCVLHKNVSLLSWSTSVCSACRFVRPTESNRVLHRTQDRAVSPATPEYPLWHLQHFLAIVPYDTAVLLHSKSDSPQTFLLLLLPWFNQASTFRRPLRTCWGQTCTGHRQTSLWGCACGDGNCLLSRLLPCLCRYVP